MYRNCLRFPPKGIGDGCDKITDGNRCEIQAKAAAGGEWNLGTGCVSGVKRNDLFAVGSLILLHTVFLWRAMVLQGFLVHSDICYLFEPLKAFLNESLRAGRLPLWSPHILCGYPIAAEGQIAAFYPPGLLISWLLTSPGAINWSVISHLMLAAVSMYALARSLLSPAVPLLADWSPPGGWAGDPDGWIEARAYLPANVAMSFGLPIIDGYAPFIDPRHKYFFMAASAAAERQNFNLYSLVGTRYLGLPPNVSLNNLPAEAVPPYKLYLNARAFPRAFSVAKAIAVDDYDTALRTTVDLGMADRLSEIAVIEGRRNEIEPKARAEISQIETLRPERITMRVSASADALVILNERWDPGWRALVDGQESPVLETDCALMGAMVPPGEHTFEFTYRPRGLIIGRAISVVALAMAGLLLLVPFARARRLDSF